MAGIELKTDIRDRVTDEMFDQIIRNMGSLRPALLEIGEHLQGSVEERFRTETDPEGNAWTPLTAFTKANKRTDQILTESSGSGLRGSIHYTAGNDTLEQGTNKIYGAIHQLGGVIKPKNGSALAIGKPGGEFALVKQVTIPARAYLGLSDDDKQAIDAILARHAMRKGR
ncbi:MAG: phage virion morphogenesis protein [Thalassospira sp.]|jgi:phage virion morphogenesis protein|uniref:phage virion morphogenesis protein n=1 Tax=Thalassospira sp. TaxID=1912094 RepID=UPI000C65AC83|nr:phage virion morphogenesis protein [Thalassospira sp.]MAZ33392.1 phage virion morphogenesis protein [Thalassospira sp.]|tara:strand:- start:176 stop:685 length:510 start_codon:yes stop_codon:yes gene_type:complete